MCILQGNKATNLTSPFTNIIVFLPFYNQAKSQLLGMKWVFKHQDLQMCGLKLNKYK